MFNSIFGTITAKLPQCVYLQTGDENSGLEWNFSVPDSSLDVLPNVGEKARLFIWTYHKEDTFKFFGFATETERSAFTDLMKVEGVGPKAALKILSNISANDLAGVLDSGDLARLEKVPGVGKKTAQKMLLALKGKLSFGDETLRVVPQKSLSPWNDVVTALAGMGYDKKEVEPLVARLADELDPGLGKKQSEDLIFRRAIVELAN